MKVMKLALLGTAALAAVTMSARADDLSELKAQIEALNARIAVLEAAPSVPAGYNLMSFSKAPHIVIPGHDLDASDLPYANTISILPSADVPAAAMVQWSGHVRAALRYVDNDAAGAGGDDDFDVVSRARLKLKASNETAVGEVGVSMDFEADFKGIEKTGWGVGDYVGYWKVTPELTFSGGFTGSLADSVDAGGGSFELAEVHGLDPAGGTSQFRLTYASGPITAAIALEDASFDTLSDDAFGVSGSLDYAADAFGLELAAGYWGDDDSAATSNVNWQVGAGITFTYDPVKFGIGTLYAEEFDNDDFWIVRASADFSLSDSVSASLAASMRDHSSAADEMKFAAGFYWKPVSQLKLGLEGDYTNVKGGDDVSSIDFVTKWSF